MDIYTQFSSLLTIFFWICSFCTSIDFDGSSRTYAKFSSWVPCHNGSVSFEFKTQNPNALLLYTDSGGTADYYQLKLVNGRMYLQFRFNSNKNPSMLSAGQNLNDNNWHMVDIIRDGRFTTLKVDDVSYTRENKMYNPETADIQTSNQNYVFIGGLPIDYNEKLSELPLASVTFEPHLKGSVQNLFFSNCGKALSAPDMIDSEGIVWKNDRCLQNSPCQNNGICVNRDNGVQCDCSWTDYVGEFCNIEKQPTEATFHGSQYLMYDLTMRGDPILSVKDRLSLSFKTTHSSGLLFYTGEGKDYMTVSLKGGAIHVAMDLGSGSYNDHVDLRGYKLDDGQWHSIEVSRDSRQITVSIDGSIAATGTTTGEFTKLSSNVLYVGGSPQTSSLPGSQVRTNFRGCLREVEYQPDSIVLDLIELGEQDHNLISIIGDIVFGQCEDVVESSPVSFTTPESYIALPRWDVRRNTGTISFQFQTTEFSGLLMYNGGSYGASNLDFFGLEILDGYFYLTLNLGSGAVKEKVSRTRVDDGEPHLVFFQYSGRKGYITVDNHRTEYFSEGDGTQLDLEDLLFIGGLDFERHNSYRLPKELWSGTLKYGYVGCLQDLVINEHKIDLMTPAKKQKQDGIVEGCRVVESHCMSQPCRHQGVCKNGWNRFICDCSMTPYTGKTCDDRPRTLMFDGAQYVLVTLPKESFTEAEDISLQFRTVRSHGILSLMASSKSTDTLEIYLEHGAVKLTISLGSGSKTLSVGHTLNDDQWHTVFFKRRGQKMELSVDTSRPVTDVIPGTNAVLNLDEIHIGSEFQNDLNLQHHTGFVGAMQKFVFNGKSFFEVAGTDQIESIEITARLDGEESVTRDPVTFKSHEAYVTLPKLQANNHFAIYFKIKTTQHAGLILFDGMAQDFLAMELYQGYLYYIYNMGGGAQRIRVNTPGPLNDNEWHDISLLRPQVEQQLIRVDNYPPTVENMKDHSARRFDLKGPLYIGGVVRSLYNSLPMQVLSRDGFLGCMASLDLNGYAYNILEDATQTEYSVVAGCSSPETMCHANSCYNGGVCKQRDNAYACDCDMTSFSGPTCTEESTTYKFGLNRGIIIFEHFEDDRKDTTSDTLAFGFKTIQQFAVLARIDSADTNDFIEMELVEGNIFVVYNMGQADIPVGEAYHKVNDGKYHVIRFTRSGANATLQVDKWDRALKVPIGAVRRAVLYTDMFCYKGEQLCDFLFAFLDDEAHLKLIPLEKGGKTENGRVASPETMICKLQYCHALIKQDIKAAQGKQMNVFNSQARIWIGGRKDEYGGISNAFSGTMSGFVFNQHNIFDMLRDGDPRVRAEGDITLLRPSDNTDVSSEVIIDEDVQSTQGMKFRKLRRRSVPQENSANKKVLQIKTGKQPDYLLLHKNLIASKSQEKTPELDNFIAKEKLSEDRLSTVNKNNAKNPFDHSTHVAKPHYIPTQVVKDHVIGGTVGSIFSAGNTGLSLDNDDTDVEYSGYSILGSGDGKGLVVDDEDKGHTKHSNTHRWDHFVRTSLFSISKSVNQYRHSSERLLNIGTYDRHPLARDDRFIKSARYPKDRGKKGTKKLAGKTGQQNSRKHSKGTTPRQKGSDDIIFASGQGPDCVSVDEEECIPTETEADTTSIFTPTIIITRRPPKETEPNKPFVKNNKTITCYGDDCAQGTELIVSPDQSSTRVYNENYELDSSNTTKPPGETKLKNKDGGHLDIFIIVGIAAAVLVVLIILVVALYKFRRREEGSYRVDESQNFAYLEAKKQQTNGAVVHNNGTATKVGKKKDVKEWYV